MSRGRQRRKAHERKAHLGLLLLASSLTLLAFGAPAAQADPPQVLSATGSKVTTSSATLEAEVHPGGKATSYYYEYGLADCSAEGCAKAAEGEVGGPSPALLPPVTIEGLSPATTYHFRVVAQNAQGKAASPDRAFTTLIAPPPFGPCPNDALRSGPSGTAPSIALPDCRAYEQASPVDKNGTSLLGELVPLKASPAGDAVAFESSSGIPGGEGAQNFPYYLSSREGGAWSTQGLLPHAIAGDGAKVYGWTPDFSFSYSTARKEAAKEEAYLARSSADGSLQEVIKYRKADLDPDLAGAISPYMS